MIGEHITLLDEHEGPNSWHVGASLDGMGNLVIDGHDLGPETAFVSSDGEYEWSVTVPAASLKRAVTVLGGQDNDSILDVLARDYAGKASYTIRRKLVEAGIPVELFTWSG